VATGEVSGMMNVFTYWENPHKGRRWKYIQICLDSIRYHSLDGCLFHHVTSENIDRYIPEGVLHSSWKNIKELGVKSDCVRAACLYLYGGIYIDADTLMIRSPKDLDTGAEFGGSAWPNPPRRVIAGYAYCDKGSEVARKWVENINARLEKSQFGWCELGEQSLTPAVDASESVDVWPLETFQPIPVDSRVNEFFSVDDPPEYESTVAFGLNHSLMTRKRPNEMMICGVEGNFAEKKRQQSKLMIHKIFEKYQPLIKPMKIGVCVPTFRRPSLLGHLISCFESQTYKESRLIAYDDCGEISPCSGERWEVVSRSERHRTLGEKRNAIAEMMPEVDAFVFWDDDDLYRDDALAAIENGLSRADWCRPSQVLVSSGPVLSRMKTYWRQDKQDKAFQCGWGVTRNAFWNVGGYDPVSLGEDLLMAKKLSASNTSECDPIANGWTPYAITCPHSNEHFSWKCKDYEEWNSNAKSHGEFRVVQHRATSLPVAHGVNERSWSGDWYEDEVR